MIDSYDEDELVEVGRRVADDPASFPIGANVSFVLPLTDGEVFIRTFERGAGLTPSCGSGVAASRAVLSRLSLADPDQRVLVRNPGGMARCWLKDTGGHWQPVLEGNATVVYRTQLDAATLLSEGPIVFDGETDLAEISAFNALSRENLAVIEAAGVRASMG